MKIKTRVAKLKKKITELHDEITRIQDACAHPDFTQVAKSSTGNWDRGQDCYWYEFVCVDCQKHWSEDQDAYNAKQRAIRAAKNKK